MEYLKYGEDGIRIVFGDAIDPVINENVRRYYSYLKSLNLKEVVDIMPSFSTCIIHFDSEAISFEKFVFYLTERESQINAFDIREPVIHEIPVVYGGSAGPDMGFVVSYTKLSEDEIIDLHTSTLYNVYTIGFMPGFPYLGTLDKRLYVPRLETPRVKVPKGSIGLAQLQTGIYTYESPGGWQIIGKTAAKLFDHTTEPYCLMNMGDKVRFVRA
jgi:inhibitor of KinA